jgi:uncharacterized protein YceK
MKAFVIILTLTLGGCATLGNLTTPEGKPITQSMIISKCPVLKQYTKEQLAAAAAEMKQLASTSALAMLVTDYGKMREACRAITKKLKK